MNQSSRLARLSAENGSISVLMVGLLPVLFGLVAVLTDMSVLYIHKRSLAATADSAAIAGAQTADLESIYAGRSTKQLTIDCAASKRVIARELAQTSSKSRTPRVMVDSTTCDGVTVGVRVRSKVTLPFSQHLGISPVVNVEASARARNSLS